MKRKTVYKISNKIMLGRWFRTIVKVREYFAIYIVSRPWKGFNNSKPEQLLSSPGSDCRYKHEEEFHKYLKTLVNVNFLSPYLYYVFRWKDDNMRKIDGVLNWC